ncbi:hypothetical protein [Nonomuraea typhae]|uniref:Protein kilB n=1 Tax=Nonomuraea typhae TaxID=2603600 RepID=A0ABW7ZA18_9ACTN
MNAYLASVIAVAGTLLGSSLTYVFQVRQSRQAEDRARVRQAREERLAAYSEFLAAATDFRRAALTHSYRKLAKSPDDDAYRAARADADRLQALVLLAIARIQLLSTDAKLVAVAEDVRDLVNDIRKATTKEERESLQERSKEGLAEFVTRAAGHLSLEPGR